MIMTAWDVIMDPTMSGLMQAWTWEQGGPYFGVPLQNYVGWLLTTFTVYAIYRFYERRTPPRPVGEITPFITAMAVFGYFTFALPSIIGSSIEELRVIALFVMGLPALAAAGRITTMPAATAKEATSEIAKPAISQDQALQIVHDEFDRRGWTFEEPHEIYLVNEGWQVVSGINIIGAGHKVILVDSNTGEILDIHGPPR